MSTLRALVIRAPYVDWVLAGKKTWEIRSRSTNIRGRIGLIKSKSQTVVGTCEVVDVIGPLTASMVKKNARTKMNSDPRDCWGCPGQYAWVLGDVRRIAQPVRYKHPMGAVTWVTLDARKAAQVLTARSSRVRRAQPTESRTSAP